MNPDRGSGPQPRVVRHALPWVSSRKAAKHSMYLIKIIGLLGISFWVVFGTYRRLVHGGFGPSWRVWFFILAALGVGLGIWFLGIRRSPGSTEQVWGFPFTIAGGEFFDGRWHNGGVGRHLYFALLTNMLFAIALCILPIALVSWMARNRSSR